MKSFIRLWLIAILLIGPAAVHASNCRAVVVRHNVVEKVIVKEVVAAVAAVVPIVATYVPVAVPVPIYNTQFYGPTQGYAAPVAAAPAYAPPAYSQPVAPVQAPVASRPCPDYSAEFRQVAQLLLTLDQRISKIEGVPPMQPAEPGVGKPTDPFAPTQPQAQEQGSPALTNRYCASCHDKSRSAASGKGFTILERGQFSQTLTPEGAGKILERLTSDDPKTQMPPPSSAQPSPADKLKIIKELAGGK